MGLTREPPRGGSPAAEMDVPGEQPEGAVQQVRGGGGGGGGGGARWRRVKVMVHLARLRRCVCVRACVRAAAGAWCCVACPMRHLAGGERWGGEGVLCAAQRGTRRAPACASPAHFSLRAPFGMAAAHQAISHLLVSSKPPPATLLEATRG